MNRRTAVLLCLVLAVLCAFGAACDSSNDGGDDEAASTRGPRVLDTEVPTSSEPLTLEEYFDQLVQLRQRYSDETASLTERIGEIDLEGSDEEEVVRVMKEILPQLLPPLHSIAEALSEMHAPPEVQAAHADFTSAFQELESGFASAVDKKLPDADSVIEILEVAVELSDQQAITKMREACHGLQSTAFSHNVEIDLRCERDPLLEGDDGQSTPERKPTGTALPLHPRGPELSVSDYLTKVADLVADIDEDESVTPSADFDGEQMVEFVDRGIAGYDHLYSELSELNPPATANEAHALFTDGVRRVGDYYAEFDDLTADSSQEIWGFFFSGLVFGSAYDNYVEGCLQLRELADEHSIAVELSCPFN